MKFGERVYLASSGEYLGTFIGFSEEDPEKVCILENGTGKVTHAYVHTITNNEDDIVSSPEILEIRAKVYAEKRASFAAAALNGLLAHHGFSEEKHVDVERAISYADTMVKLLSKR